jgi:hypothetical protein
MAKRPRGEQFGMYPAIEIDLHLGDVYQLSRTGCAAYEYAFRSLQKGGTNLLPYLRWTDTTGGSRFSVEGGARRASTARLVRATWPMNVASGGSGSADEAFDLCRSGRRCRQRRPGHGIT